jgi:hypothetical protein
MKLAIKTRVATPCEVSRIWLSETTEIKLKKPKVAFIHSPTRKVRFYSYYTSCVLIDS